jgi:hypothetical protein
VQLATEMAGEEKSKGSGWWGTFVVVRLARYPVEFELTGAETKATGVGGWPGVNN